MFTHILVPLDLTARNLRAVDTARDIARAQGARVTLLHVIQRLDGIPVRELQDFYARLQERAQLRLRLAARRLTREDIDVSETVFVGSPVRDIVRHVNDKRVDLIVMSSHAVKPSVRPVDGFGTTSYRVALLCPCPILLVK
jgi:nucleotide-binding universal stress UspA family protein